jgi:hypothetical protein
MKSLRSLIHSLRVNTKTPNDIALSIKIFPQYNGKDYLSLPLNYDHRNGQRTRHILFSNQLYSLYLLTWVPRAETNVHYHPKYGCVFYLLDGCIIEHKYSLLKTLELYKQPTKIIRQGECSYINNLRGPHKIVNGNWITHSLHLYAPGEIRISDHDLRKYL